MTWRGFALKYNNYKMVLNCDMRYLNLIYKIKQREGQTLARYIKVSTLDGKIVDAISNIFFVTWDKRSTMATYCDYDSPYMMGIISYDSSTIWHIEGRPLFPSYLNYQTVTYEEINKEEFDILRAALDNQEEPAPPEEKIPEDAEIQFIKEYKIKDLSKTCNQMIENGIDITLSDEEIHHFSLTKEDQINLMECKTQLENGDEFISYHADNEICTYYSAADMLLIINTCIFHKKYHITYFNSLKHYVDSLETLEDISDVSYGIEIPIEYQSEPLKNLLEIINNNENETN